MTTTHQRQAIRDAVTQALTYKTDARDRVFPSRFVAYRRPELPAIAVYTLEESVDADSRNSAPRELIRSLHLAVEVCVLADDKADDALDALCLQIERCMHADETFGGACGRSILSSVEISADMSGDRPLLFARHVYDVTYYTYAPDAADVTPVALKTVDVKTSLGGVPAPVEDKLGNLDQQGT